MNTEKNTPRSATGGNPGGGARLPGISFHRDLGNLGRAARYRRGFEIAHVVDAPRIAAAVAKFPWSPIMWRDGQRLESNFLGAYFCVLDFDDGSLSLAQATNIWCDAVHVIGTTKSHQVSKSGGIPVDRFRVLLSFGEVIEDIDIYRATMQHYIDVYGADEACKDGARFFWPCKEIVSVARDGYTQEIHQPQPPRALKDYSLYREHRFIPRWIEGILKFGVPDGMRNNTCFKIGIYLTKCGYGEPEIVEMIMRSRVPIGPEVRREVEIAVRNGAKRGRREVELEEQEKEEGIGQSSGSRSLRTPLGKSGSGVPEKGRPVPPHT